MIRAYKFLYLLLCNPTYDKKGALSKAPFFILYILFFAKCYYSADAGFAAYEFPWEAADDSSLVA